MIVYVLFVHKISVSKRKVCIIFIKNIKFKKTPKNQTKTILVVFLVGFFGFFGWVFYCQPCIEDSSNLLTATRSCFRYTGLDYAFQISMLQARILSFQIFFFSGSGWVRHFCQCGSRIQSQVLLLACYTENLIVNFHFFYVFFSEFYLFCRKKRSKIYLKYDR